MMKNKVKEIKAYICLSASTHSLVTQKKKLNQFIESSTDPPKIKL